MHPAATQTSQQTIEKFQRYVIPNYTRYPISLVHGEGSYVWDAEGKRYLDLFPGWGCDILGHAPPRVVKALQEQAAHLIHIPNTWYTEAQGNFAEALCTRSFGKAFFANSGAEANEAAIKLARLHFKGDRYQIITFQNGFHGRTFATVTATAQPKYHAGLGPMMPGFIYCPHNDLDALKKLVSNQTCAIMIEPIQGEGGINIPGDQYFSEMRALADKYGALLIFDEVQTCMGRTGTWFGYQQWNVQPDILTMAKGVAGGVACGVMIAKSELAGDLRPGMHASTFGGNPIAMAAGLATIDTIEQDKLLEKCKENSDRFKRHLTNLASELSIIKELRIRGMMIGIDLKISGGPAVGMALERGVLINSTHDTVIRLLPALNITSEQVDEGCAVVAEVLRQLAMTA
ncbi:MAG: argD 2 [Planctomycetaceae bacterium]|nr:argD 2 [Planctomycetaceae bacterium]